MRIFLDVTRTLAHAKKRTPTGIDRVEHAYIRFLLNHKPDKDAWFVVNTPFGRGILSASEMSLAYESIQRQQQGHSALPVTDGFKKLLFELQRPITNLRNSPLCLHSNRTEGDSIATVAFSLAKGFRRFHRLANGTEKAIYLHTSHVQLDRPRLFQWLDRPSIFPAFFIHDLIPIEYPEFCGPGAAERHRIRIETALRLGRALIVNSEFTKQSLLSFVGTSSVPPIAVVPLANSIDDRDLTEFSPITNEVPYFLHVGTIEGRKNIPHLLNVWREVIRTAGFEQAPRLVLIGQRGWECESVLSILDRSRELANHVIEVSDVNDVELRFLMRYAHGLVSVSMTEGYGLPPIEAVRLGTPVVVSDIPAHREILGRSAQYVAVHDGAALAHQVLKLSRQSSQSRIKDAINFAPVAWDEHVDRALTFLEAQINDW